MPTPICENELTEKDKMTIASASQRTTAWSLCITRPPDLVPKAPGAIRRKPLCRKKANLAGYVPPI
jgi:hypothetical protein